MRFFAAILLTSCFTREHSECEALKTELDRCLGSRVARLDCSAVADSDVRQLRGLVEGTSCDVITSALPFDGDLQSATCRLFAVGCVTPVTPAPAATPTRFPVLLVNGIDTSPLFRYSDRIVDTMAAAGHPVFLATLTPFEPPPRRAPELWARIEEVRAQTGAEKVNLVCHSLGGLDCRYLASPHGFGLDVGRDDIAGAIASITTVGTAHRGTRAADLMLGMIPEGDTAQAIDDFASVAGDWFTPEVLKRDAHVREALTAISTVSTAEMNTRIDDAPGVYLQSFAGVSHPLGEATAAIEARTQTLCSPDETSDATRSTGGRDDMALPLVPFDEVVGTDGEARVSHDGLVPVSSARWGVFRGCIPADHMEQLGQRNLPDANVKTGVDIARFYAAVAADLAARGF